MAMAAVNFIASNGGQRDKYQRNGGTLNLGVESSHASQGRRDKSGKETRGHLCP